MASKVTLSFAAGTFLNSGTNGGVFVHLGPSVSNAAVVCQGVSNTTLENNSVGAQFGGIVQDEGTGNTVSGCTMDAGGNSTSTFISIKARNANYKNLKLIHDLRYTSGHNYAFDLRGGSGFNVFNVETVGGSLDGFAIVTHDFVGEYRSITSGTFSYIRVHDSPYNGIDITPLNGDSVSGLKFSNVYSYNNGSSSGGKWDTHDDQFGLNLATLDTTSSVSNLRFAGIRTTGNRGSGIRLKGNVTSTEFTGIIVVGNGRGTSIDLDGLRLVTGAGTVAPRSNTFGARGDFSVVRRGRATYAVYTDWNTSNNSFTTKGGPYLLHGTGNVWH
jgi:hypothetical protein